MECPICFSPTPRFIFQKDNYRIHECIKCHHRFVDFSPAQEHSAEIYRDEYFYGGQAGYPNYLGEEKILITHGKKYAALLKKYTTPGTMLDVGAAAGFLLKGFTDSGWSGVGLEPNANMASYGNTHLGLHIETGNLEQFSPSKQFDLVNMIQVIAHFFDLRQALRKAADLTRNGGYWLIETWNSDSWVAQMLGANWHEYSPPSVLHYFSVKSLSEIVSQFGFTEVARGRPVKLLSSSHAKSLLEYKLKNSSLRWSVNALKMIPDDIPIRYPAFDLFWILFRKNI